MLLYTLVQQMEQQQRWGDEQTQARALAALANICSQTVETPALLPAGDARVLRFYLLHQSNFGSDRVRAQLRAIPQIRKLLQNPYLVK